MTLQAYNPEQLDQLALQMLDLAAAIRHMANRSREHGVTDLVLHDKKALEWCAKLQQWTHKVQSDLEVRILQSRAEKRGRAVFD